MENNFNESQKINYYVTRTFDHIHRVHKNAVFLVTNYADELDLSPEGCRSFLYEILNHDRSKFNQTQFIPYIELTEYYRQRKNLNNKEYNYPFGIEELVNIAVNDHYKKENHHAEMLLDYNGNPITAYWGYFNAL